MEDDADAVELVKVLHERMVLADAGPHHGQQQLEDVENLPFLPRAHQQQQ
jgi:hypothetical protein